MANRNQPPQFAKLDFDSIVLMGKHGDLINMLPVAREAARHLGKAVPWFFSPEFGQVFDGVSYVEPVPLKIPYWRPDLAHERAKRLGYRPVYAQVWGRCSHPEGARVSKFALAPYNMAAWLVSGFTRDEFFDRQRYPLVFDKRDLGRETHLLARHGWIGSPKFKICVATTIGETSPYRHGWNIYMSLRREFGDDAVVNVGPIRATRIYDFLTLLETADLIIASDNVFLHLAAATETPVVAIVRDDYWGGSKPRCRLAALHTYADKPERIIQSCKRAAARLREAHV
jgi:hypothetical protein